MHELDRKIEYKIADFNNLIIRQKLDKNGTTEEKAEFLEIEKSTST